MQSFNSLNVRSRYQSNEFTKTHGWDISINGFMDGYNI